jgi:Zn-dependent protease with chaperone function
VDADGRSDPRGLYALQVTVAGAGLAGCALGLAAAVSRVHIAPAAAHRLDVGGARFTYPAANAAAVALFALAALGVAVLFMSLRGAWRQVRAHRRLVRALPVAGSLPGHPAVCVVDVAALLAFCAGWLQPRIYVSTGTLSRLSESELRAVLAHEHHHRARRDPLRLAVGRVLSQALFFLPVLRPLHERYGDVAELTADAAALEATGCAGPLASAMLSIAATPAGEVVGISPERVDALLGQPRVWRLPWLLLEAAMITIAALVALVWRVGASASAQTSLDLPIASSQPCLLVLALVPILVCLAGAGLRGSVLAPSD